MKEIIINQKKNGFQWLIRLLLLYLAGILIFVFGVSGFTDEGIAPVRLLAFIIGLLWMAFGWAAGSTCSDAVRQVHRYAEGRRLLLRQSVLRRVQPGGCNKIAPER